MRRILGVGSMLLTAIALVACGASDSPDRADRRAESGPTAGGTTPRPGERASGRADSRPRGDSARRRSPERRRARERELRASVRAVQRLLRGLARGISGRDPSICTRLFTRHRLEVITRVKGAAAVAKCRRDIARSRARFELTKIEGVRIHRIARGNLVGRVQFLSRVDGKKARQLLEFVRVGGTYRIDKALRAQQPR